MKSFEEINNIFNEFYKDAIKKEDHQEMLCYKAFLRGMSEGRKEAEESIYNSRGEDE